MAILGWVVGKGSTPIDDWFQSGRHSLLRYLLFFSDSRTVFAALLVGAAIIGRQRGWRIAAIVLITPVLAVSTISPLKQVFGRMKGDGIAYPSGHTTWMVVTLGMVVIGLGVTAWRLTAAIIWALLGIVGISVTFHYFTDAVGSVLLGTSCVVIGAYFVDRCQPQRDVRRISQLR